ncbi:MAG: biotin transporter BioY [Acidobacteria bacterium]|jgi:biotin transport system substrate-specific component|nr:biotin transporter BioY [Acidobacteriota bacterium]
MAKTRILQAETPALEWARQAAIVIGASLFVALCAKITLPLPFTPVPLTLQNFGVLFVGLTLGSRRGFAALLVYLAEGAAGLPVFSPLGPGGIAQILGPTGGFLMAYPFVAFLAGWIMERGKASFLRAAMGGLVAEMALFLGGLSWLAMQTHSLQQAMRWGLYWFVFAEIIKIFLAAGGTTAGRRALKLQA